MLQTSKLNYTSLLTKIQTLCKKWAYRDLTLLGKIQVCNSLVLSQFWYRTPVLMSPQQEILNQITKEIRQFLWNGKIAKVSYEKLIQTYDRGGLKLQDIFLKDWAFKVKWITNLQSLSPFLRACFKYFSEGLSEDLLPYINLKKWSYKNPSIWGNILDKWCKFSFYNPTDYGNIKDQSIWYNSHINIRKENFTHSIKNKARLVNDIITKQGEILSIEQLNAKFQSNLNFINYAELAQAIPKALLVCVKRKILSEDQNVLSKIKDQTKRTPGSSISKIIYLLLLKNKKGNNNQNKIKWEQELGIEIRDSIWEGNIQRTNSLTNSTKLRYFQYRLENRLLVTNYMRNKWDPTVVKECTFCHKDSETIVHLLYDCPLIKNIWKALKRWLYYFCFIELDITVQVILFNRYKDSFPQLVNTIILVVKQYIYAAKCLAQEPKFREAIARIQYYKTLEKAVAKRHNKLYLHEKKWEMYDM